MNAARRLWLEACLLAALGCSDVPAVRIIGECRLVTDAVAVVSPGPESWGIDGPGIGVLGEHTFVAWNEQAPYEPGERPYAWQYGQWLDGDLEPIGERIEFGRTFLGYPTQWVRQGDALYGQMWAEVDVEVPREQILPQAPHVYTWLLAPGEEGEPSRVDLDTVPGAAQPNYFYLSGGLSAGPQGALPSAVAHGVTWSALTASPGICDGRGVTNENRLHLVRDGAIVPLLWGADPCDSNPETASGLEAGTPWLVPLRGDKLGLLLRTGRLGEGAADGAVRYLRIAADGSRTGGPRRVGGTTDHTTAEGGYQPRGASVGGSVIFTERSPDRNDCHFLRIMQDDGSDARDAPWQLPCRRPGGWVTSKVELLPVPGGAVLVWTQRSELDDSSVHPGPGYDEAVFAVILTPEAQRGSEVLRVTDPRATTIIDDALVGAFPGEFAAAAAADGTDLGVTWLDVRSGVPELYVRRIVCRIGD